MNAGFSNAAVLEVVAGRVHDPANLTHNIRDAPLGGATPKGRRPDLGTATGANPRSLGPSGSTTRSWVRRCRAVCRSPGGGRTGP
jgi:hypothetical protein